MARIPKMKSFGLGLVLGALALAGLLLGGLARAGLLVEFALVFLSGRREILPL